MFILAENCHWKLNILGTKQKKKVLTSREKIWYSQPEAQSWYRYEQKILRIVNNWGVGIVLKLNRKFKTTYEVVKVEYSIQRENSQYLRFRQRSILIWAETNWWWKWYCVCIFSWRKRYKKDQQENCF